MPTLTRARRPAVSDDDLLVVAEVAAREGWEDLAQPPLEHPAPRTLEEAAAVGRFAAAAARAPRSAEGAGRKARLAMAAAAVVVLGICWYVSPARTALALLGVGLFSLVAMRRRKRRDARPASAKARGPFRFAGR